MNLHFQKRSECKQTILFLNGWGATDVYWQPLLELLTPHFNIITVDYPGCGQNFEVSLSIDEFVESLNQQIYFPFFICAWSYGGLAATLLAALAEKKVLGLIQICVNPCFVSQDNWPGMAAEIFDNFYLKFSEQPNPQLKYFQKLVLGKSLKYFPNITSAVDQFRCQQRVLQEYLMDLKNKDYRNLWAGLKQNSLAIFSDDDNLVPLNTSECIKKMSPYIQTSIVHKGSHAPFYVHPQTIAPMIKEFCHV